MTALGIRLHTSNVSNAWPSKDTYKLTRGTAIIADRYNVCQSTIVLLRNFMKHIYERVGSGTTTENDDSSSLKRRHGQCKLVDCMKVRELVATLRRLIGQEVKKCQPGGRLADVSSSFILEIQLACAPQEDALQEEGQHL